ncbi:crotonase/enoyl-CoA hydratase family protein [Streptosporangium sp. NPDC001681]|uniref:crotonase/enoyl-CoA hydratase family protein n=1 Tax=Streptosporangium sp. NPDC001681 TaxID=3154395 RepID=UPI00332FC747
MTGATDSVLFEEADGVATITLNRPEVRNAVDAAMAQALAEIVDHLNERSDLRVAILTGAGGSFCSGMDLKAFVRGERSSIPGRGFAGFTARPPAIPVIAAVEGAAVAGGCELVLACDLVVAGQSARFGVPEVKRGLVAVGGALLKLPARIPYQIAMEWILTGDMVGASRAHDVGLVNAMAPDGDALAAARAMADRIASNGPLALRASKEIVMTSPSWRHDEAYDRQLEVARPVMESADAREGALAFAEKRRPVWSGR